MKRNSLTFILVAGLLLAFGALRSFASDSGKQVTITGDMVCGKCTLHLTKHCQNVVQVHKNGKTINYFLKNNAVSNAAHDPICSGGSEKVSVTGTVAEMNGKEIMTPKKIKVLKS